MVNPNINSFGQTTVQGQLDLQFQGSVISARVASSQVAALIAGQAIKIEDSAGGVPAVLSMAANSDPIWGFVIRNLKDQNDPAYARLEVALEGSVMYMTAQTANPAIARGAPVEYDYLTNTVLAWGGINQVIGYAYDKAASAGDLIRVWIKPPAFTSSNAARTVNVTATTAQINAGLVIIPGVIGKRITVTSFKERVIGAYATGTSVDLRSDATAVIVESTAEAGLTNGAVLNDSPTANVTLGAGYATPLPSGEGLKIVNVGAAQTVGTSIQFTVTFTQA